MNASSTDNSELKLKYAWDWFSYHAAQRLTGFRFFLVSAGILLAALGRFSDQPWVVLCVCLFGAMLSTLFVLLDFRNAHLLSRGEAILANLEEVLFAEEIAQDSDFNGLLRKETDQPWCQSVFGSAFAKHAWIIPVAELSCLALFLGLIVVLNDGCNLLSWSKNEPKEPPIPVHLDVDMASLADLTNAIDMICQDIEQLRQELSIPNRHVDGSAVSDVSPATKENTLNSKALTQPISRPATLPCLKRCSDWLRTMVDGQPENPTDGGDRTQESVDRL